MSDNGYVYVLINPSINNFVKIGKTTREPEERAKELSSGAGVPTPFVVVYSCYFENCSDAETFVHTYLENKNFRVSSNREFFEIPIKDAIDSVIKAKEYFGEFETTSQHQDFDEEGVFSSDIEDDFLDNLNYKEKTKEPWEDILDLGDTYYYGFGDEIQDYKEAMVCYLKAIKLGSSEAYLQIGNIYRRGEGVNENNAKALQYYKEGAKKGNADCYGEMAQIFETENVENALKCWNKYFKLIDKINLFYGIAYIMFIDHNRLELRYKYRLRPEKDNMISLLNEMMLGARLSLISMCKKQIRVINSFFKDELITIENEKKPVDEKKPIDVSERKRYLMNKFGRKIET